MTDPEHELSFDRDAVNRKYAEERSKRAIEGRAATRDLNVDEHFASYRDDPFTPYVERDPIDDEVDVAIIGAGLAGVLAGADLRDDGIERIRLIDGAGGIGGTWYWNRYPGVMCDVESYVYMPKLEEMGLCAHHSLCLRRRDPAPPRRDRAALRARRRRAVPHDRPTERMGRGERPLDPRPPTGVTRSAPTTWSSRPGSST